MGCRPLGKPAMAAAITAALSATLLLWMTATAFAAQSVTVRAALHEGFGRVVFDWPVTTAYQAKRDGRRLLITFETPFTASFDRVKRVLDGYLSDIRLAGDGRTVEIDLSAELEYRAFAYGEKIIVDLMDPVSGAPGESTDAESGSQPEPQPESMPAPETPRERVNIRIGDHPNFSRVVFDWPGAVGYRVETTGNRVEVRFDRLAEIDLSALNAAPPKLILSAEIKTEGKFTLVTLVIAPAARVRHFRADLRIVIDALAAADGAPREEAAAPSQESEPEPAKAEQTEAAAKAPEAEDPEAKQTASDEQRRNETDTVDDPVAAVAGEAPAEDGSLAAVQEAKPVTPAEQPSVSPAEVLTEAEAEAEPETEPEPEAEAKPAEAEPAEAPLELAAEPTPDLPPASEEPSAVQAADPVVEIVADAAQAPPVTIDANGEPESAGATTAQLTLGPPPMTISVVNETNRTLVTFNGGKRTSAAAFVHGDHVWVIFEEPFAIDLKPARATKKTAYSMIEKRKHDTATVLRFKLRDGFGASMRRRGIEWMLQITPSPQPPEAIEVRVIDDNTTNERVQLPLARVGNHIQIRDPADRSTIDVVPVMASGSGIPRLRRFSQFDLLATLQGVAISGPSQIQVFTTIAGVEISTRLDPSDIEPQQETVKQRARPVTTLFDLVAWRRGNESEFAANRSALHRAVATANKKNLGNARLDLARFLFAHGYMAEAYGVLELLIEQEPRRTKNLALRAMRGVMNLAMYRVSEAVGDLSDPVFEAYDDIALWRGVLAMKQGDLSGAAAYFDQAGDLWLELPSPLRDRVGLMSAEAILANNDLTKAKAQLDILRSTSKNYDIQQRVKHLLGRLLLASQKPEEAVDMWRKVIAGGERLARARAIYDDTMMQLDDDQITLKEAIYEIEGLRYAWRSDEFELTVLRKLAALYVRNGEYRKGLSTMKLAVTYFSTYSATAEIATRMNELFAEIFLRDGAEDLPAIDALALYFEFQELTPVGVEGDEVIQKLADRLVALDLLGRATELLDHQLKYRLRGIEMARVGTRLAVLHLMNGTPEGAIRALRRSRLKNMPDELLVQRRHIRARALADLGRDKDALKRLAGDNSVDAELLRADISWRAGDWVGVAEATERLLDITELRRPLTPFASRQLLRYAVVLALANDQKGLKRLNRLYAAVMREDTNEQAFDVITSDTDSGAGSFKELPNAVARVASFEAFMSSYRERVKNNSLSAIN